MKNYYEILEVKKNASPEQIKESFVRLMAKYHPDIYSGDKNFAQKICSSITEAYSTLRDPEKRRTYDIEMNLVPKPTVYNFERKENGFFGEKTINGRNYEQEVSKKYFRNAKRKKSFFKRVFTSKLFYSLLFVFAIEIIIIFYFVYSK